MSNDSHSHQYDSENWGRLLVLVDVGVDCLRFQKRDVDNKPL